MIFVKVDRNTYRHSTNSDFEVRIYAVDGFYGADLWYKENDFVSLCAHRRRSDVLAEVRRYLEEWATVNVDIVHFFKMTYLNEYCRPFEMEAV